MNGASTAPITRGRKERKRNGGIEIEQGNRSRVIDLAENRPKREAPRGPCPLLRVKSNKHIVDVEIDS